MKDWPKFPLGSLENVNKFVQTIREYRAQDIVDVQTLQQVAGYAVGFRKVSKTITTNMLIGAINFSIDVATAAGVVTLTLEPSPIDGQVHVVTKKDASTNNVTISGNGFNINGTSTISFNTQYEGVILIYMGGSGEWRAIYASPSAGSSFGAGVTPVTDGTYTVGLGLTINGTITTQSGIITAITQAS